MADRTEVLAAIEQWTAKANGQDWGRVFALLTDDAVVWSPVLDQPITGRRAVAEWVESWGDYTSEIDVEWAAVDGTRVAVGWRERLPNGRPPAEQPSFRGIVTLVYAGDGRFSSFHNFFDTHQAESARRSARGT